MNIALICLHFFRPHGIINQALACLIINQQLLRQKQFSGDSHDDPERLPALAFPA
jgi:hypothetical protein